MLRGLTLLLALLAGCARPRPAVPDGGFDGARIFLETCAKCHGERGKGDAPQGRLLGAKDLTRDEVQRLTDVQIAHQILTGGLKMPAFSGALSDDEIAAVVRHVRGLPK